MGPTSFPCQGVGPGGWFGQVIGLAGHFCPTLRSLDLSGVAYLTIWVFWEMSEFIVHAYGSVEENCAAFDLACRILRNMNNPGVNCASNIQ